MTQELLQDYMDQSNYIVKIKKPQEFSSSIAKLMCVADEAFNNDCYCYAYYHSAGE